MNTRARRAGVGQKLHHSWLILLLGVVVSVAGCATTPTPPQPTATRATAASTAACRQSTDQSPVPMAQVWGKVSVRSLPNLLPNNYSFVFENTATPDGQWLLGNSVPRDFPNNGTAPSYLALQSVATGQVQMLVPLLTPQNQIYAASSDGQWIVWTEIVGVNTTADWTLRAYNRSTGQVKQLAQVAKNAQGQPALGPVPSPVVAQGIVVWNQGLGPVNAQMLGNAVVREEDLNTGVVTTLATSATYVTMSWPWVAWAQAGSGSSGHIQFKNLVTGQTAALDDEPSDLVIQGTSTAYVDQNTVLNYIADVTHGTSGAHVLGFAPDAEYFDELTMSDRLIAWNQNSSAVVYDRLLHCFVALPVRHTKWSLTFVTNNQLFWVDNGLFVVDVSTLPQSVPAG